jgi:Fe-S-cluster-containing dehydrogenase component
VLIYCHHCTKPPCKDACPAEAIFRNEQGVVLINEGLCIGCKESMEACSFGAMQFDEDKEAAVKCDLCIERLENNEQPACTMHLLGNTRELSERIAEAK